MSIKDGSSNDEPIFIWEIVEQKEKTEFLINSKVGMSKNEILDKFPNQKVLLPDGTKFKLISSDNLNASYGHSAGSTKPDLEFFYDAMGQRVTKLRK